MPAVIAIGLGVLLGLASGGDLRQIGRIALPGAWVIFPLFVVQGLARGRAFGMVEVDGFALPIWLAVSLLLVGLVLRGWRTPGMALVATGIALNLLVVLLNAAMPVAIPSTATHLSDALGTMSLYQAIDQAAIAAFMGDVLSLDLPTGFVLLSAGDVALMVGVCTVIVFAMLESRAEAP